MRGQESCLIDKEIITSGIVLFFKMHNTSVLHRAQ